jgi:hypothetical protein
MSGLSCGRSAFACVRGVVGAKARAGVERKIIIIVMTPRRSIAALIAYRYCTRFSREQKA